MALSNVDGETVSLISSNVTAHSLHPAVEGAKVELGLDDEVVQTWYNKDVFGKGENRDSRLHEA